jgi:hypothetical protein
MSLLRDSLRAITGVPKFAYRSLRWRTGHWLPHHLLRHRPFDARRLPSNTPIDLLVLMVDHFEPIRTLRGPGDQEAGVAAAAVREWCQKYERVASRYQDHDGRPPQYTWFYAADFVDFAALQALSASAFRGFGEVEFHLHHGHDTEETFTAKLQAGLDWFNRAGAMQTAEPQPRQRFAYIAGDWSLDNGTFDDSKSGCNTELGALRRTGCYADFTYPALGSRAQPRKTNAIYYATDCPRPKSHDWGTDVAAGRPPSGDLMLFQGPLVIDWRTGKFEDGSLERDSSPSPDRLACWLKANVHVRGRPEWVFVKLFTHGIQNRETVLGPAMDTMLAAMAERWNRPPFRLHFVTAREAYNIVKAAEAGLSGNPNEFRDYEIPPPANRRVWCSAPYRLLSYAPERIRLEVEGEAPATVEFAQGPLRLVRGRVQSIDVRFEHGELAGLDIDDEGDVAVTLSDGSARTPATRAEDARRIVLRSRERLMELPGPEQVGHATGTRHLGFGLDVSDR